MIEERRQDICEHLENTDNENAHDNPLPYLLRKGRFHNLPEQQTERSNDDGHENGRPEHEAFGEGADVHDKSVN